VVHRREFLAAAGALLAAPLVSFAQQPGRTYRLGWLQGGARTEPYSIAFVQRLGELGFVEGRNFVIELRTHGGRIERLPELAGELARQNCDVLFAGGTEPVLVALKQATRDTPIVLWAADYDPVATGHIVSFARPGGRITGVSLLQSELPAKRVELLKELLPSAKRIAVLADTSTTGQLAITQTAAKALGLELQVLEFRRQPYDYENAFAEAVRDKAEAMLALASSFFVPARQLITALALKHRVPSMHHHSGWADVGGLLSYGPNFSTYYRLTAEQVGMVLNGRNPAEMPVQQPTAFELVVNMKTAKALGLTIPQSIRLRADRMIE